MSSSSFTIGSRPLLSAHVSEASCHVIASSMNSTHPSGIGTVPSGHHGLAETENIVLLYGSIDPISQYIHHMFFHIGIATSLSQFVQGVILLLGLYESFMRYLHNGNDPFSIRGS